ncbi:MAG: methyltransferase domain-containing protein [Nitrosopumilus sp.]|nr:methyltransferase domain-containing protein [Nitrosopumilus sp.]
MPINESNTNETHWAETFYVNHSYLYLPLLENLKKDVYPEVEGLCKLFKEFKIPRGSKILDLSCGIGRHSIPLAKEGYEIVGYDPSQFFLEKAMLYSEQELVKEKKKIKFYKGITSELQDVLYSNNEINFNAIIIMFNSFGYIDEAEDIRILKQLHSIAETGCILVIETENRDWTIMNTPHHYIWELDGILSNEIWEFDQSISTAHSRSKFYKKDPNEECFRLQLELQTKLRLYSMHELKSLLSNAGWSFLKSYGNIRTLENVSLKSQYIVTISKKI